LLDHADQEIVDLAQIVDRRFVDMAVVFPDRKMMGCSDRVMRRILDVENLRVVAAGTLEDIGYGNHFGVGQEDIQMAAGDVSLEGVAAKNDHVRKEILAEMPCSKTVAVEGDGDVGFWVGQVEY
jgi:hypothetical protein